MHGCGEEWAALGGVLVPEMLSRDVRGDNSPLLESENKSN